MFKIVDIFDHKTPKIIKTLQILLNIWQESSTSVGMIVHFYNESIPRQQKQTV